MKLLTIGMDVDDVLFECAGYALQIVNEQRKPEDRMDLEEIRGWGKQGTRTDAILELFNDPEFYRTQPVRAGAAGFIHALVQKGYDLCVVTAVRPQFMKIRMDRLTEAFPELPEENIILTARKEFFCTDILLDDGPHNIKNSGARYPVVYDRPWNRDLANFPRVRNYGEFLKTADDIAFREFDGRRAILEC